jgi:hypothetical protein
MRKERKATHHIYFSKYGSEEHFHTAFGKTDLLKWLADMIKDGYTDFKIVTI